MRGNPGYRFDYYNDPAIDYGTYERRDPWGFYSKLGTVTYRKTDPDLLYEPGGGAFPTQALYSLKQIDTPGRNTDRDRIRKATVTLGCKTGWRWTLIALALTGFSMWNANPGWVLGLGEALDQLGSTDLAQMETEFHDRNTTQLTFPVPGDIDRTQAQLVATHQIHEDQTLTYQFRVSIDEATADFYFLCGSAGISQLVVFDSQRLGSKPG